jgi:hypothetical protein
LLMMIAVVAAACDSDSIAPSPFGLAYAAATRECVGPLSESGVAIYLANAPVQALEPEAPYVRIILRQPLQSLREGSWVVAGNGAQGAAWRFSTATDYERATSGEVTVNVVASDSTIEGWADLTFPSAGRVGGNFRALWISRVLLCI